MDKRTKLLNALEAMINGIEVHDQKRFDKAKDTFLRNYDQKKDFKKREYAGFNELYIRTILMTEPLPSVSQDEYRVAISKLKQTHSGLKNPGCEFN